MNIKQKIRFIRDAQPKCLEELFEMQNRVCDLCGQAIQNLVCASVDHSIEERLVACAAGGKIGGRRNLSIAKGGGTRHDPLTRIGKLGGRSRAQQIKETDPAYYIRMRAARDPLKLSTISTINGTKQGHQNVVSGHMARLNGLNASRRFQRQVNSLCSTLIGEKQT